MIRPIHPSGNLLIPSTLALVAALVGCSSHVEPGHMGAGNGAGVSSSSSSGGGTPTPSGSGGSVTGTMAGSDLAAPAADTGIQIETPDYNAADPNAKNMIVQPGQEIFLCYYVTLPNTAEVDVGAFQSWMSPASSHHFIVYQQGGTGPFAGTSQPSGTINSCIGGGGTWVYASSTPGEVVTMKMPDGVGLPFPAAQQLVLNMHFINTGTDPLYPKLKLNVLYASNVQYKAAALVSFNIRINVPAATASGPGTQTVSGTCTAPVGSNFFLMSTHTHKHATAAAVNFVHNGQSQEIVHTGDASNYPSDQLAGSGVDWEHPGIGQWSTPNFLTTAAGDSFTYSCTYSNTASTPVTVGETAASNEMCMAVGYFFPAGRASCN
jgi:hypothetical protein